MPVVDASGNGLGLPTVSTLLTLMEAGVPIPLPTDLVLLGVGQRAASGHLSVWVALVALEVVAVAGAVLAYVVIRGPTAGIVRRFGPRMGLTEARIGRVRALIERRRWPALVTGRATPGLRTATVVAAGSAGIGAPAALPALALGSTVFIQAHLVLGYLLGGSAQTVLDRSRGPALLAVTVFAAVALVVLLVRRGRGGARSWTEACCPACLAVNLITTPAER